MLILTIRTDKPEAEVGIFDDSKQLEYDVWHAHRELSITLHQKIVDLLAHQGRKLEDVQGIVGFAGPGSFTGLRIGLTVANALSYGLNIPVVATQTDDWVALGINRLLAGEADALALPEYGAPVHITQQKK
ncbi:MAG TPA: tRNA (adenosine(37)-N6)-threonylcarbamoyltransferase complex dimerization subunit type 1 TsaB [Candidatus Saccharimonadales bacterium]|nr:tRNA (adenosine(37)-N6)-threonylcarbamoyltransferase complex dimerization subunit type 1 TsaB [Candidatus Saccharimonadales bacterium]